MNIGTLLYTAPYLQRVVFRFASFIGLSQGAVTCYFLPKFYDGSIKLDTPLFESQDNRLAATIAISTWVILSNAVWYRFNSRLPSSVHLNGPMKALVIKSISFPSFPKIIYFSDILSTSRAVTNTNPSLKSNMAFILETKNRRWWFSNDGKYTNRSLLKNLLTVQNNSKKK